ncbi:alpha/beta hydrolase [Rhodoferax sp.]|uniref:alpha/beta hydrolase n=1 Tax=Rhodoferax sp. TaxID=50421 RepID=UPI002ACECAA0|nr:alpha/beta fold hydrolase [Rhodoferax sp.]MDZ7919030.1 alpha/beta fold hydrolase [Rhodoferax sp.]
MNRLALVLSALVATSSSSIAAEQAIELETPTGVIKGTLTMPPGDSRTAVVLLIAGSGPTDRDGNTPMAAGKNDSLKLLAAALRDNGVASVRYDKRGIAASSRAAHAESDLRFEDYVQDAASWATRLAKDSRFTGVAVLGHSEGSLIGMLASQRSPSVAFISVAGPAERASVVLRRQLQGRLPPDLATRNEEILSALESGSTASEVPPPLLALYRPSVQPYLISWFKYSPSDELVKLRMPCLLVQGGTDIQVGVADAEALHAANKACVLRVVAGMNHVMKSVPPDRQKQIASYGDPALPLNTDFTEALASFFSAKQVRAAFGAPR